MAKESDISFINDIYNDDMSFIMIVTFVVVCKTDIKICSLYV